MSEIWILFNQPIPLASALLYFPFSVIFDLIVRKKKNIKRAFLVEHLCWMVFLLICVYFGVTLLIFIVILSLTLIALKLIVAILKALK